MVPAFAFAEGEASGKLVVGDISELSGTNIFTTAWGNNASDKAVRDLIFPLDTVVYTRNAKFEVNPTVVKEFKAEENEDGTKTFIMTLNEGLVYNEGTAITAKDYLFAALLTSSRAFDALGGTTPTLTEVVGQEEYRGADEKAPIVDVPFKGLRLIDDYTFSVTIIAEELPYYYDIAYAAFTPYPMFVIAPDADVKDDGEGAYITGDFTVENLEKTINDPKTGYRFAPMVTAGPYKFVSFDPATKMATVEANPLYPGNYTGAKPQIKTIVYTLVKEETQLESLRTGAVDIIKGMSGKDIGITMDMVEEENEKAGEEKFTFYNYPRAGYGKIAFHCDFFPTDSVAVRQALALSLDRPEFARQYSDGYAQVVNSRYGVAQWMYFENAEEIEAALDPYTMDLERAKSLLIEDGWVYAEDGSDYVEGIRYKEIDGEFKPLIIKWADTDNSVAQLLRQMLPENLAQIGMGLDAQVVDFPVMLEGLYRNSGEPTFNMFNLGTGFSTADSPWFYYDTNPEFFGQYNSNFIADEQLRDTTANMKKADNDDDYYKNWFDFVVRFNEVLPDIPLYSDDYHDFFTAKLQNYEVTSLYPFADAILDCTLAE